MRADVAVIGGGLAGVAAAKAAIDRGKKVVLVRKSYGATGLFSGCFDIAGDISAPSDEPWGEDKNVRENLRRIALNNPAHPYHLLIAEQGNKGLQHLQRHLDKAVALLRDLKTIKVEGSTDRNIAVATVFGTFKFTTLAVDSIYPGNLLKMKGARLLVVGIDGLRGFDPRFCSQSILDISDKLGTGTLRSVDYISVKFPRISSPQPSWVEVTEMLDTPEVAEELARVVKSAIEKPATCAAFPPVLGLDRSREVRKIVREHIGLESFELLPSSPSIPGLRLQRALDGLLRDSGVEILHGRVSDKAGLGKVDKIRVTHANSETWLRADAYVLATGRFVGGGISSNAGLRESVFGLPVWCQPETVEGRIPMVQDSLFARHGFFQCGIEYNHDLQPVGADEKVAYDNLFAAGSVLKGYDYVAEKCGSGVALLTGYLAGEKAGA